jgi:hypothetical protein
MSVWKEIDRLFDRYDGDLKLDIASECMWGGSLRLTLFDATDTPAESIAFFAAGGAIPDEVANRLLRAAKEWLAKSGCVPLPVGYTTTATGPRSPVVRKKAKRAKR